MREHMKSELLFLALFYCTCAKNIADIQNITLTTDKLMNILTHELHYINKIQYVMDRDDCRTS